MRKFLMFVDRDKDGMISKNDFENWIKAKEDFWAYRGDVCWCERGLAILVGGARLQREYSRLSFKRVWTKSPVQKSEERMFLCVVAYSHFKSWSWVLDNNMVHGNRRANLRRVLNKTWDEWESLKTQGSRKKLENIMIAGVIWPLIKLIFKCMDKILS